MIRPPPISTLFPYTTLFRSAAVGAVVLAGVGLFGRPLRARLPDLVLRPVAVAFGGLRGLHRDRKSTRLNSSHPSISYAVFCLKKKKTKNAHRHPHTDHEHRR